MAHLRRLMVAFMLLGLGAHLVAQPTPKPEEKKTGDKKAGENKGEQAAGHRGSKALTAKFLTTPKCACFPPTDKFTANDESTPANENATQIYDTAAAAKAACETELAKVRQAKEGEVIDKIMVRVGDSCKVNKKVNKACSGATACVATDTDGLPSPDAIPDTLVCTIKQGSKQGKVHYFWSITGTAKFQGDVTVLCDP